MLMKIQKHVNFHKHVNQTPLPPFQVTLTFMSALPKNTLSIKRISKTHFVGQSIRANIRDTYLF